MEQDFVNLLIENIQFNLRHPAYKECLNVRDFAKSSSSGEGQDDEVTRGRRFEEETLKAQRIRLYNSRTQYALARPRKYWKRIGRVEGIRRNYTAPDENRLMELLNGMYNFQPGKDLETWLNETLERLGVFDPNTWIVYERHDERDVQGQIAKTIVWPFIVSSVNALNFAEKYGVLKWFLCRTTEIEQVVKDGRAVYTPLENFYLYYPGGIVRAREVGEKTVKEDRETLTPIEIFPEPGGMVETQSGLPVYSNPQRVRNFYVSVIDNGTTEVPALRAGCYEDDDTETDCFVPWFNPAKHVLNDLIRNKSALDVIKTVHTYPKRYEFVKPCQYSSNEIGECTGGYINGIRTKEHICPSCNGSGMAANFTTEQQAIQLVMPESPEGLVELSKLAFVEPVDISLPEFLEKQIEADEARIMAAVFDSGMYQKPNDSTTKTATEIDAVQNGIADVLAPFTRLISKHVELAMRVGAQYMEIPNFKADHSYPDDFDISTLSELVMGFQQIKDSGVGFEAIAAQRKRVYQKVFEGDPGMQKRIAARWYWKPFDDKSEEQTAMILASRSPLDDQRVLYENWLEIFKEIENETPEFANMTTEMQKKIVSGKITEYKQRIILIDEIIDPTIEPEFMLDNAYPGATN